jgi:hypothetical protein
MPPGRILLHQAAMSFRTESAFESDPSAPPTHALLVS